MAFFTRFAFEHEATGRWVSVLQIKSYWKVRPKGLEKGQELTGLVYQQ